MVSYPGVGVGVLKSPVLKCAALLERDGLLALPWAFSPEKTWRGKEGGERVNKEAEIDWFGRGRLSPFWNEKGSHYWENGHKCALFP